MAHSSKNSIWPILVRIVVDYVCTEPFLVGAYCGGTKEDVHQYLDTFIVEYKELNLKGFDFSEQHYYVQLRNVLFDTPARCQVLNILHYLSYDSCPRCFMPGKYENGMFFPGTDYTLREDSTYRQNLPSNFCDSPSPFEKILNFKPISQVPLDPMHLLHLGIMKRFLSTHVHASQSKEHLEKLELLNQKLSHLNKFLPLEFNRVFRSTDLLAHFKATELRKILLYAAPVIFKDFLTAEEYTHFLAFHCACRILADSEYCFTYNNYAQKLINYYVENLPSLYSNSELTPNAHYATHLAQEVLRHGPLESFSNYPYENYLFQIKQLIRNGNLPLSQIFNRLAEREKANIEPYTLKLQKNQYKIGNLQDVESKFKNVYSISFSSIKFENFELTNKFPNNCTDLQDNTVLWIDIITQAKNGKYILVGRKFSDYDSIPQYPCDSKMISCYLVKTIEQKTCEIQIDSIKRKEFLMPFKNETYMTMPLLH